MKSKYYIKPNSVGCHGEVYWAVYERRLWRDREVGSGCMSKQEAEKALKVLHAYECEKLTGGSQDTQTP